MNKVVQTNEIDKSEQMFLDLGYQKYNYHTYFTNKPKAIIDTRINLWNNVAKSPSGFTKAEIKAVAQFIEDSRKVRSIPVCTAKSLEDLGYKKLNEDLYLQKNNIFISFRNNLNITFEKYSLTAENKKRYVNFSYDEITVLNSIVNKDTDKLSNECLANYLHNLITEIGSFEEKYGNLWNYQQVLDEIEKVLREDAAPVKHAHWCLVKQEAYLNTYECSKCGRAIRTNSLNDFPYCNCGAKMDEVIK